MITFIAIFVAVTMGIIAFLYAVMWDSRRGLDAEFYAHYSYTPKKAKSCQYCELKFQYDALYAKIQKKLGKVKKMSSCVYACRQRLEEAQHKKHKKTRQVSTK